MFRKRECDHIADLLWPAAAHRLKEADLERVERHLEGCAACREQAEEYRQTVRLVTDYADQPVPASEATWQSLLARLETPHPAAPISLRWRSTPLAWSGAVVGAVVLLLLISGSRRAAPRQPHAASTVTANRQGLDPSLSLRPEVSPKKGSVEPSAPVHLVENTMEDAADQATDQVETRMQRPTSRRHYRRRRLHATRHREMWFASENHKPTWTPIPNVSKPVEMPSVDGDRPAVDPMQRQYVLTAVASPTEGNTVCDFVMEGVSAETLNSASAPGSKKEMQAW